MLRAAAAATTSSRATSAARGGLLSLRNRTAVGGSVRRFGSGGGGDMPVPQSANAQLWQGHPYREGWESTMTWWYGSSFLLLVGILGFAPNTDIESWARQEALARIKGGGEGVEFGTHSFNIVQENRDSTWDKFAVKAIRMTEEDDDDDDDEDEEGEEDEEEDDDE